jgi:hypothetical protein
MDDDDEDDGPVVVEDAGEAGEEEDLFEGMRAHLPLSFGGCSSGCHAPTAAHGGTLVLLHCSSMPHCAATRPMPWLEWAP